MWREKSNRPRSWIAPSFPLTVHVVSWVLGAILLAFVALPLIGLATTQSKTTLAEAAMMPDVRGAIALSLEGALLSALLAAMFGVPLGYVLARSAFPGKNLIGALIDIPLAVPHTVAGIALLIVFGRRGILGGPADQFLGLRFWGTIAGIVVAMLFVSAPYTVNAARLGFEAVDPRLEKVKPRRVDGVRRGDEQHRDHNTRDRAPESQAEKLVSRSSENPTPPKYDEKRYARDRMRYRKRNVDQRANQVLARKRGARQHITEWHAEHRRQ